MKINKNICRYCNEYVDYVKGCFCSMDKKALWDKSLRKRNKK